MRRDFNRIRRLLLDIEARDRPCTIINDTPSNSYHIRLAIEGGLLLGTHDFSSAEGDVFLNIQLAELGHDFLELCRDDEIWDDVQECLKVISGSTSFDLLCRLLTSRAERKLGLVTKGGGADES